MLRGIAWLGPKVIREVRPQDFRGSGYNEVFQIDLFEPMPIFEYSERVANLCATGSFLPCSRYVHTTRRASQTDFLAVSSSNGSSIF